MARIQDIRALEGRISDAVQEFIDYPEGYEHAHLHVWLDPEDMTHKAEMVDTVGTREDGYYPAAELVRQEDNAPDVDKVSEVANEWVFIDH